MWKYKESSEFWSYSKPIKIGKPKRSKHKAKISFNSKRKNRSN